MWVEANVNTLIADVSNTLINYNDLLDIADLQKILGIGRSMAYNLIKKKQIGYMQIGKQIRVLKVQLLEYINKNLVNNNN